MVSPTARSRIFWITAILVVLFDATTKWLAKNHLDLHMPHAVLGDVVRFPLAYTPGAAFSVSLGKYSRFVFGAFACVAEFALYRLYRTWRASENAIISGPVSMLALGLCCG